MIYLVRATGEFLTTILTEGFTVDFTHRVTKGLPKGSKFVEASVEQNGTLLLSFEHPSGGKYEVVDLLPEVRQGP